MAEVQTKVYSESDSMVPRTMVRAMVVLVLATLAIVVIARVTDRPLSSTVPESRVQAEVSLILEADPASGAATVYRSSGHELASYQADEGGFIAGITRVIARERTKHRVALDGPVTLQAYENGRMAILDPATGWRADLMGFGADNAEAFARLLALAHETGGNT